MQIINQDYEIVPIGRLREHPRNPRRGDTVAIADSIVHNGFYGAVIAQRSTGYVLAGNHRLRAARDTGAEAVPVVWVDVSDEEAVRIMLADNRTNDLARYDDEALAALLGELRDAGALDGTGYSDEAVAELLGSVDGGGPQDGVSGDAGRGSLSDRFLVPPFSVLDGRQGYWIERKRWWISLGIRSEIGRGNDGDGTEDGLTFKKSAQPLSVYKQKEAWEARLGRKATWEEFYRAHPDAAKQHGTSVFDPVLAEVAYTWYCPRGGLVLDPFAGGSVRGVVAAALGRQYIGVDLSARQIESNRAQWDVIAPRLAPGGDELDRDWDPAEQTPIERRGVVGIRRTARPRRPAAVPAPRWIVGNSLEIDALCGDVQADMVFSCPPYFDLERYSDDPADLSNMPWEAFLEAYRAIIARACGRLREDRFAVWVIGEVRDPDGYYRNLLGETILAFRAAGLEYYGEAAYITPIVSLCIRIGSQFPVARKMGKTHQNVLVFVKGDWRRAVEACGPVEVFVPSEAEAVEAAA